MKKIFKDLLFVIIALVIFFYTFIQSDYSLTNEYYFTYYIISLFFILGIILFFFQLKQKIKITITFLSILFSLYLIEGYNIQLL